MANPAISGNVALIEELRPSLFPIYDEGSPTPTEISTPADRFTNTRGALEKAKNQGAQGLMGSKHTRPQKIVSGATPEADNENVVVAEGILSAEAILSQSVMSPTGTQAICTLDINAATLEVLAPLRTMSLSGPHQLLAKLVPQAQGKFATKPHDGACYYGAYGIVNPMLLAANASTFHAEALEDVPDEMILECVVPFTEIDGFATLEGTPAWERQEWERIEFYNAFKLYRDMRYAFYNEADLLITNRSLATLAKAVNIATGKLNYLSKVYCWPLRVQLYDAWMETQRQRRWDVRHELMLDRHSKVSQALVQKAYNALSRQAEKLSPKEALEMLKLGLQYERLSLGLPGDKPVNAAGSSAANTGPSINIVNQNNAPGAQGAVAAGSFTSSGPQQQLQDSLKKPDTLLSVLAVLQRSNAFNTLLATTETSPFLHDTASSDQVIDVSPVQETAEEPLPSVNGAGFSFNELAGKEGGS